MDQDLKQPAAAGSLDPVVRRVPFQCEVCHSEGHVEDPKPMESISCECGARYLHWPDGKWKCVVRPVFAPNDQAHLSAPGGRVERNQKEQCTKKHQTEKRGAD